MNKVVLLGILIAFYSCKHPWTQTDKENVMGGCMTRAVKDMGDAKARTYCGCMLEKLQKRYPNAADVKYAKYDTALYSMAQQCLK